MDIFSDTIFRAEEIWKTGKTSLPDSFSQLIPPDVANEYGLDCVRIAWITAPDSFPDESLLEAAHCWLSRIHRVSVLPTHGGSGAVHAMTRQDAAIEESQSSKFSQNSHRIINDWKVQPWLQALGRVHDHLLLRRRLYPALAAFRLAFKHSPLTALTPDAGKSLILSVLYPFAPFLSLWLGKELNCPLLRLDSASDLFPPWKAFRLRTEKGGWQWEVFNSTEFTQNPHQCIEKLPWWEKSFSREFSLIHEEEGWKICLPQAIRTKDSFSSL